VHPHLFHHLVKEVFSLGVGAGLEDPLEVVEQGEDVGPVELREPLVLALGREVEPPVFELLELFLERLDVLPEEARLERARLERCGVAVDLRQHPFLLGGDGR
jgi:hypothetical protein